MKYSSHQQWAVWVIHHHTNSIHNLSTKFIINRIFVIDTDGTKSQCSSSPDGTTYEGYGERQLSVPYSLHQGRSAQHDVVLNQDSVNNSSNKSKNNSKNKSTSSGCQNNLTTNGDSSPSTDFNNDSSYLNSTSQQ